MTPGQTLRVVMRQTPPRIQGGWMEVVARRFLEEMNGVKISDPLPAEYETPIHKKQLSQTQRREIEEQLVKNSDLRHGFVKKLAEIYGVTPGRIYQIKRGLHERC